jgi:hypothetical protein
MVATPAASALGTPHLLAHGLLLLPLLALLLGTWHAAAAPKHAGVTCRSIPRFDDAERRVSIVTKLL